MRKALREFLQTILLSLLVFAALQLTIQNFRVEGSSMEHTLLSGQYLLVNKLVYYRLDLEKLGRVLPFVDADSGETRYLFHPPQRGEVVVFRYPLDPSRDFVKRVVAVPGDAVEIRDGNLYVNDELVQEPYVGSAAGASMRRALMAADEYFVLGDNRPHSNDSRSWGPITIDDVIGRAWLAYWPFSGWKLF